jgi:GH25 family lysozyme M1 (1,4-beta-N-acetylmuramidase)
VPGSLRTRAIRTLITGVSVAALAAFSATTASATPAPTTPRHHYDADHMGQSAGTSAAYPFAASQVIQAFPGGPRGLDVASYQGNVNWSSVAANGGKFAYVKATEGTGYTNPYFGQQYTGSYYAGLMHAAYHFALPNVSGGATQADYFVNHGGGWSRDGKTLPGALDIEYNPYGSTCYGYSQGGMVNWIASFINEYHYRTGRWAVIYSTTNWWAQCTGNYGGFWNNNPGWIANYSGSVTPLPYGMPFWTFWQYANTGVFPGDQDVFNGDYTRLQALANG